MRAFIQRRMPILAVLSALLFTLISPSASLADDDKDKNTPPAKAAASKPDAPAPLTERERMLLDRVEQLEKRVADLEAKKPAEASPGASVGPAETSAVAAGAPAANTV